jgi:hypothetical protein
VRHPNTALAWTLLPLWLLKRELLAFKRWRIRRSSVDRWFDAVDDDLVVGGALFPGDLDELRKLGVGAVLSLCAEYADDGGEGVVMHRIPVHDDFAVSEEQLLEGVAWIDARAAEGKKVYVHCAAGRGRSVSVVVAWLVKRHGLATDEALARVQAVRRAARPTSWQLASVRRLEKKLREGRA